MIPSGHARWALAVAAVAAIAFIVSARAWSFLCDDAFIAFRYARHLADSGRPEFNLGEAVEGYSSVVWVAVLAVAARFGGAPHIVAPWLTVVASAGLVVAAVRLAARLSGQPWTSAFPWLTALLLTTSPEVMVWSGGGLETSATALATVAAMLAWSASRYVLAAGLAALAWLLRMDAAVPIAAFGLAWLLVERGWARMAVVPWRRWLLATLVFAVPVLGHLLWRHAYYGSWMPNTWTVKAHGALLRGTYGRAYVGAWASAVHLVYLLPLLLLLRPRHVVLVAPIVAVIAYGFSVGGDFMAYGRFYLAATVLLAVLVAWLLSDLAGWLAVRFTARGTAFSVALGVGCSVVLGVQARTRWSLDRELGPRWIDGRWEGVTAMARFAAVGFAAGQWMRTHLPADTRISVGAAGAVPYGSDFVALDAYGLTDPVIASLPRAGPARGRGARPGHQLFAPAPYVERWSPDLHCHVGYRGPKAPPETTKPPGYRTGFAWSCIEIGPLEVRGEAIDGGVYCCLRSQGRALGPWGSRS